MSANKRIVREVVQLGEISNIAKISNIALEKQTGDRKCWDLDVLTDKLVQTEIQLLRVRGPTEHVFLIQVLFSMLIMQFSH